MCFRDLYFRLNIQPELILILVKISSLYDNSFMYLTSSTNICM